MKAFENLFVGQRGLGVEIETVKQLDAEILAKVDKGEVEIEIEQAPMSLRKRFRGSSLMQQVLFPQRRYQ